MTPTSACAFLYIFRLWILLISTKVTTLTQKDRFYFLPSYLHLVDCWYLTLLKTPFPHCSNTENGAKHIIKLDRRFPVYRIIVESHRQIKNSWASLVSHRKLRQPESKLNNKKIWMKNEKKWKSKNI